MFTENCNDVFLSKIQKDNALPKKHEDKHYSSEEHATANLTVPCVFLADTAHASMSPLAGIRASLQVQLEINNNKEILPPAKPRSKMMPMCHDHNDPLFEHTKEMVETSISHRLKHEKEAGSFAANDFNSAWHVFDDNEKTNNLR